MCASCWSFSHMRIMIHGSENVTWPSQSHSMQLYLNIRGSFGFTRISLLHPAGEVLFTAKFRCFSGEFLVLDFVIECIWGVYSWIMAPSLWVVGARRFERPWWSGNVWHQPPRDAVQKIEQRYKIGTINIYVKLQKWGHAVAQLFNP